MVITMTYRSAKVRVKWSTFRACTNVQISWCREGGTRRPGTQGMGQVGLPSCGGGEVEVRTLGTGVG